MSNISQLKGLLSEKRWAVIVILLILLSVPASICLFSGNAVLIPVIPFILATAIAAFISIEKLLVFTVFLVPLSIQLRFILPDVGADLFLPTEPVLAGIMLVVLFKLSRGGEFSYRILTHPVTLTIAAYLAWIFITSLTGEMVVVSLKYFVTRLWFIAGFYLLAAQIFLGREKIYVYFTAFLAGLTPVALYYLVRLSLYGVLNQETAYAAIRPFFNDHTALGASLAFAVPAVVFLLLRRGNRPLARVIYLLQLLLFSTAFIYSYSRAAWVSLAVAGLFIMIAALRISWKLILPASIAVIVIIAISWNSFFMRLNENRQNSSLNFREQVISITNIRTDASNLERLNRWSSALRMASERPFFGWGPGTYQFVYGPFQMASEKTEISTDWGERGNAHSEYLGLLSETGVAGMVIYILLLFLVLRSGIRSYNRTGDTNTRILLLMLIAGIVTYMVHGALNNFLDTDKISCMFWGMTAAIVAIETVERKSEEGQSQ